MNKLFRSAITTIAFSLFASASLLAQSMTISPSPSLPPGGIALVEYVNASLAGADVVVTVTGDDGVTKSIAIRLDAAGKGSGSTTVPSTWRSAQFQAPSVPDQTLPVG